MPTEQMKVALFTNMGVSVSSGRKVKVSRVYHRQTRKNTEAACELR